LIALDRLQAEGVTVVPNGQSYDFGKFGWLTDLEGNRVELWQPIQGNDSEPSRAVEPPRLQES
jgi:hypothetical protein